MRRDHDRAAQLRRLLLVAGEGPGDDRQPDERRDRDVAQRPEREQQHRHRDDRGRGASPGGDRAPARTTNTTIQMPSATPHDLAEVGRLPLDDVRQDVAARQQLRSGTCTSPTPYGFTNTAAKRDRPRRRAAARSRPSHGGAPSTQRPSRCSPRYANPSAKRAVHVRPQPEQHRHDDERVAADEAVGHLDDPEQHEEEQHADQQRPLRPEV